MNMASMNNEVIRLVDITRHFKVGLEIVQALRGVSTVIEKN